MMAIFMRRVPGELQSRPLSVTWPRAVHGNPQHVESVIETLTHEARVGQIVLHGDLPMCNGHSLWVPSLGLYTEIMR